MSKESFKLFVKERPSLASYVNKGEMTWQKFYEMYEMYGGENSIWDKYTTASTVSLKSFFDALKGMDMTEVQKGIGSLQKGIGYLKDMVKEREAPTKKEAKEPRRIYEHFDD